MAVDSYPKSDSFDLVRSYVESECGNILEKVEETGVEKVLDGHSEVENNIAKIQLTIVNKLQLNEHETNRVVIHLIKGRGADIKEYNKASGRYINKTKIMMQPETIDEFYNEAETFCLKVDNGEYEYKKIKGKKWELKLELNDNTYKYIRGYSSPDNQIWNRINEKLLSNFTGIEAINN